MKHTFRSGDLTLTVDDDPDGLSADYRIVLDRDGRRMPISETTARGDLIRRLRRFLARDYIQAQFDGVVA